jgi:ABC-2 type transport system ATP-binding protein
MTATVELTKIRKSYGSFVAVDDLTFAISSGQIFGLLGPNGAGKTSTIRMMIGITAPDSGEVRVFGVPLSRSSLHRVGYLPEERGLYRRMTVRDNLVFLARLSGLSSATALDRIRDWCKRLETAEWLGRRVEELSKGMQQKIQFIAALLHDPELIIMDEPFAGLDPVNSMQLRDVLTSLRGAGKTILFSTHRMDQVEKLCDSICLIDRGKSVLQGSLNEIKSGYGRRFVQIDYDGDGRFARAAPLRDERDACETVPGDGALARTNLYRPYLEKRCLNSHCAMSGSSRSGNIARACTPDRSCSRLLQLRS